MLDHPVRRIKHTAQAAAQLVRNAQQDLSIFLHKWNSETALRQRRLGEATILVRADEDVGRDIYFYGEYEKNESSFVLDQVRQTDICFDIGANVGYYTVMMARRAVKGQVHAFEPVPLNYHIVSTNVLVNNLNNVVVNRCAISDQDGDIDFVVAADGAFSSMRDTGRRAVDETIKVPVVTIDSYCSSHGITHVDVLKADVEGAEESIVRGAAQLLQDSERRPRLIMLELQNQMLVRYDSSIDRMLEILQGYGYRAFVCQNRSVVEFRPEHYERFYNVCFLSESLGIPSI